MQIVIRQTKKTVPLDQFELDIPRVIDTNDLASAIDSLGFDVVREQLEKYGLQHILFEQTL